MKLFEPASLPDLSPESHSNPVAASCSPSPCSAGLPAGCNVDLPVHVQRTRLITTLFKESTQPRPARNTQAAPKTSQKFADHFLPPLHTCISRIHKAPMTTNSQPAHSRPPQPSTSPLRNNNLRKNKVTVINNIENIKISMKNKASLINKMHKIDTIFSGFSSPFSSSISLSYSFQYI